MVNAQGKHCRTDCKVFHSEESLVFALDFSVL